MTEDDIVRASDSRVLGFQFEVNIRFSQVPVSDDEFYCKIIKKGIDKTVII